MNRNTIKQAGFWGKTSGILGLACLVLLLGSAANADPVGKTNICHKPGEHNQRIHSIDLDKDGPKHFGHGDYLVTGAQCDAIADNNCDGVPDAPASDDADCVAQNSEGYTCEAGTCLPPPEPPLLGKCTGKLQEVVVIWNGDDSVNLTPGNGVASLSASQVEPGDVLTIFTNGSTNDVFVNIAGSVNGESKFHISCSDGDMNADNDDDHQQQLPGESQDCGKFQGDAKSTSGFINTWLLEGMLDADGLRLVCNFDPTT
jgi:hypothetical protein